MPPYRSAWASSLCVEGRPGMGNSESGDRFAVRARCTACTGTVAVLAGAWRLRPKAMAFGRRAMRSSLHVSRRVAMG